MRNSDGSFAGAGTYWGYYEGEETYEDNTVNVRLPYDFLSTEERKGLSGEVKTYRLEEL